jgi:hypothetical protein
MNIPILDNHDWSSPPIGVVNFIDNGLYFHFIKGRSRKEIFDIFGNIGYQVLDADIVELDGTVYIKRGHIVEWSLFGKNNE